jgi:hypothetical protein
MLKNESIFNPSFFTATVEYSTRKRALSIKLQRIIYWKQV